MTPTPEPLPSFQPPGGQATSLAGHYLAVDVDGVLDLLLRCAQTAQALDLVWPSATGWCRWQGRLRGAHRGVGGWWLDGPPAGLWLADQQLHTAWRLQKVSRQGLRQWLLLCDAMGQPLLSLARAPGHDAACWHALLDEAAPVIGAAGLPARAAAAGGAGPRAAGRLDPPRSPAPPGR